MIIQWGNTRRYPQYSSPFAGFLHRLWGGLTGVVVSVPTQFFRGTSEVVRVFMGTSETERVFTGVSEVVRVFKGGQHG